MKPVSDKNITIAYNDVFDIYLYSLSLPFPRLILFSLGYDSEL